MLKIASWNVNSIKARLPNLLEWLDQTRPEIALLQETKTPDESFPRLELESRGWHVLCKGQKSYNGVAILSRQPLTDPLFSLPGMEDDGQARYLEASLGQLRVACLYLPNGNPPEKAPTNTEKLQHKLRWMDCLKQRAQTLLGQPLVLGGDFNVIPEARDVYNPKGFAENALFLPEVREKFRALQHMGLTDACRALYPEDILYTFWDYQWGAWQKNYGMRIDHFLLSPLMSDRLQAFAVDKEARAKEKPSDHAPIWCEFAD